MKNFINMEKVRKNWNSASEKLLNRDEINERIRFGVSAKEEDLYKKFDSSKDGKSEDQVEQSIEKYGENVITPKDEESEVKKFFKSFLNPFTLILISLAIVSLFTDVIFTQDKDYSTVIIILIMVSLSGITRYVQEAKSNEASKELISMIENTTLVKRAGKEAQEMPIHEIAVGDLIYLSAGDMIPADLRLIRTKDLFISQSSLTGESAPVEKISDCSDSNGSILEKNNLAFMGTNVVSGSAVGIVLATGDETVFGSLAGDLNEKRPLTSFDRGVNGVSMVLIKFMLVMVPIVFLINGFTKGDRIDALLFSVSVAVGLTPEMLPMIVTTTLAKGSVAMSKKKVIIKNLNSIHDLGAINILCTDKTGTLTQDRVALQYYMDLDGKKDVNVLKHGFLNSYYQTGLKNLMDKAIISKTMELEADNPSLSNAINNYEKVDEIPFDFERRRMSVVVKDKTGKTQMITKGAVEEMLKISDFIYYKGEVLPLTEERKKMVLENVKKLNDDGMRVIAVAQKTDPAPIGEFSVKDEDEMVLMGYLSFLDPPKETAKEAIDTLKKYGVSVKVITGDNELVTRNVCKQVGIDTSKIYTGSYIDNLSDEELGKLAKDATVFAKVSPSQKARIVSCLKGAGNTVGFMGDGINDASALEKSDVGISVDSAVDIAKEAADIILLEKDLNVLKDGIIEGRKTYANMIKYIKITASSNFGNVFSVMVASIFLPFLPMKALHLLMLNLVYDISCTALPWDNVDKEFLERPKKRDPKSVSRFMLRLGPTSSVFDITTYRLMYFVICPMFTGGVLYKGLQDANMAAMYIAIFQAGRFIESMRSQTMVIHMLRSPKLPIVETHASFNLTILTSLGIVLITIIPFTAMGRELGFHALPKIYFLYLLITVICYLLLVSLVKKAYLKKFKSWL